MTPPRLGQVLRQARGRLREDGIEGADIDARLLIAEALGIEPARLSLQADRVVSASEQSEIDRLIRRRLDREPVGRILGSREFWSLPFRLSQATLEPRPDTETLVEAALDWIDAEGVRPLSFRFADLGTGSGAVLVALLHECPLAFGVGTDISLQALETARFNAETAGVAARAGFASMSYLDGLSGGLDLIVSNPPYIPSADIEDLSAEVRLHDPMRALDGGSDGLDAFRRIARRAGEVLRPGGMVFVEVGAGQDEAVTALFADAGLSPAASRRDLSGKWRIVAAQHHP